MKAFALLALSALALAACAENREPLSADFGNSVNANISVQVVNPNPGKAGLSNGDGTRIGNAIERYHTNKVYHPNPPLQGGKIIVDTQAKQ